MTNIILGLSRYVLVFLLSLFTLHCFIGFGPGREEERKSIYILQAVYLILLHTLAFLCMYYRTSDPDALFFCALQNVALIGFMVIIRILYPKAGRLLVNNMLLFLSVGLIMIFRLSRSDHFRQFIITALSLVLILPVPYIIKKAGRLKDISYGLGISGLLLLSVVLVIGRVTRGSRLSVSVAGVFFQPSEFVKILFIFCLSGIYSSDEFFSDSKKDKETSLIKTGIALLFAVAHVLILVLSKDLGGALIFFTVYWCITYAALKKTWIPAAFAGTGALSFIVGYKLFPHVRNRVLSWRDPFTYIENQGYQITQSLFAIGTGSWFGMGLFEGSPDKIPIVARDFIFSAVSEELGSFFSILLIMVIVCTFLLFINTAMDCDDQYFRLVSTGIAACYGFQTFLNIGGVIRFIPLTGVTLPLVSYGGSSLLSTVIMFGIILGIMGIEYE